MTDPTSIAHTRGIITLLGVAIFAAAAVLFVSAYTVLNDQLSSLDGPTLLADCERRNEVSCDLVDGPDGLMAVPDHYEMLTDN